LFVGCKEFPTKKWLSLAMACTATRPEDRPTAEQLVGVLRVCVDHYGSL
jgi:hypothetical protein